MSGLRPEQRARGGAWGVLVGDAIGAPWEFGPSNTAPRPTPAAGFLAHQQPSGTWTDDGAATLALADSIQSVGWSLEDQGARLLRWWKDGAYTAHGTCFDIGGTTRTALESIQQGSPAAEAGPRGESTQANGALMRILPVLLCGRDLDDSELVRRGMEATQVTHGHPRVTVASALYLLYARVLLDGGEAGEARELSVERLNHVLRMQPDLLELIPSCLQVKRALGGAYVADSLVSAFTAIETTSNFRDCVEVAISYGNDTDTTAAIAGGLAGVRYGAEAIPSEWFDSLTAHRGFAEASRIINGI